MRRSRLASFRLCLPLVAVCLTAPGVRAADDPPQPVSVNIRPLVIFAGGDVRTTVRTPRDPRNRELRIVVEAADYYASSDVQLDGDGAAATHQHTWKALPGGAYRVEAILLRADGERRTVTSCFAVLSGDEGESVPQPQPRRGGRNQPPPQPTSNSPNSSC
jgi:hypothetical protein